MTPASTAVQRQRRVCTIIAKNYLAQARVLAESYAAHHVGNRLCVLIVDDLDSELGADEAFDVVHPDEVMAREEFNRLATMYGVVELATAIKPWLLRHLLGTGASSVAYFDPDIRIFTPLHEVFDAAEANGLALTPHALAPLPTGGNATQTEDVLLDVGIFNLGFVAVGGEAEVLDWWAQRLARECVIDPARGRFVDQRWMDLAMGYFAPVVLRDPGMNVAWWNLASRRVAWDGGTYAVDGRPLRFFHFSGYDPAAPWLVSSHQGRLPRVRMAGDPALQRITGEYAAALRASGYESWSTEPYALDHTPGGLQLTPLIRTTYRNALIHAERAGVPRPPNPFTDGDTEFVRWLAHPDEEAPGPAPAPLLGHSLWRSSPDLQMRFRDIHGQDSAAFRTWLKTESPIASSVGRWIDDSDLPFGSSMPPEGLHVVGLLGADRSEGELGRRIVAAARRAGIPTSATAITRLAGPACQPPPADDESVNAALNVVVMPWNRLGEGHHGIGSQQREGRRTALVVTGPSSSLTELSPDDLPVVDEIWVLSNAARDALQAGADGPPVFIMPPALGQPATGTREVSDQVLVVIDAAEPEVQTDVGRALEAFGLAGVPSTTVIHVTVLHVDHDGILEERLAYEAGRDSRITWSTVRPPELVGLIRQSQAMLWIPADADASPWVVDAVSAGTPVVASSIGQAADLEGHPLITMVPPNASPGDIGLALRGVMDAAPTRVGALDDDLPPFLASRADAALAAIMQARRSSHKRRLFRRRR